MQRQTGRDTGGVPPPPPGVYGERESLDFLERAGVAVVPRSAAASAEAAVAAAEHLGYPVVLKVSDPEVLHKTDVGGVRSGIVDGPAVCDAYRALTSVGDARVGDGDVLVERQLGGLELLVGVKRDPYLGPAVVLGAGGTLVEVLDDVAMEMAPISLQTAYDLIRSTQSGRLLAGFRSGTRGDTDALARLLVQIGELAIQWPGLQELDLNPVIVGPDFAIPVDARMMVGDVGAARKPREPVPAQLFSPHSIAVVGASADSDKPGNRLIRYLQRHGYRGRIVPVNSRGGVIAGLPAVSSIRDLADPVDLACLAAPGEAVPEILLDCADRGIPAAIVFSAGFAEAGSGGEDNQSRLDEVVTKVQGRLRYCGPNSMGVISPRDRAFASFSGALEAPRPLDGSLAFVTQSGAVGSALVSRAWERGIGFSRWVSTGNEHDLDVADYLAYLADDDQTNAVLMFLESIRDGGRFRDAALRCVRNGKGLLAYKTGRSDLGHRSVMSHTGAIAGDDAVYDAFLRSCGVLRVDRLQGLVDGGLVMTRIAPARGRRVAIITMSGGAASVMADRCADLNLELPPLPPPVELSLRQLIPDYGTVANPIDVTVDAVRTPEMLTGAVRTLLASDEFDLVLCQLTTNADPSAAVIAEGLLETAMNARTPLLIGRQGADSLAPEGTRIYRESRYPLFDSPERVVEAAAILVDRWDIERRLRQR